MTRLKRNDGQITQSVSKPGVMRNRTRLNKSRATLAFGQRSSRGSILATKRADASTISVITNINNALPDMLSSIIVGGQREAVRQADAVFGLRVLVPRPFGTAQLLARHLLCTSTQGRVALLLAVAEGWP